MFADNRRAAQHDQPTLTDNGGLAKLKKSGFQFRPWRESPVPTLIGTSASLDLQNTIDTGSSYSESAGDVSWTDPLRYEGSHLG